MKNYCLWLGLSGKQRQQLGDLICYWAKKCDAPVFTPHITLAHCKSIAESAIRDCAAKISAQTPPFAVAVKQLQFDSQFFRCVFIELKLQSPLVEIHRLSYRLLAMPINHYMPHISLIYGNISANKKQKIIQEIIVPQKYFQINEIQIIKMDSTRPDDPMQWQEVARMPLVGQS